MVILDQFADWEGAFLASALTGGELSQGNLILWASADKEPKKSIGGTAWRKPEADLVLPVVRSFLDQGKAVGFICDAARFAAWAGFLNGVRHAGNDPAEMKGSAGYTNPQGFQMEDAVWDGQIVTANGNSPLPFAQLMLKPSAQPTMSRSTAGSIFSPSAIGMPCASMVISDPRISRHQVLPDVSKRQVCFARIPKSDT